MGARDLFRATMVFLMGNYTAPWNLRFNPFIVARSGRPYNVVTGYDLTGDNFINDRPGIADSSQCSSGRTHRPVCFDIVWVPGFDTRSGRATTGHEPGNSPASVAVNMRLSRAFGIGPKLEATAAGGPPPGGPGGGPPGGGRGGGPGGGFGPGGFGGGGGPRGMFGPQGSGRKYSLNFSVQALNLFNNINYGTPTGTISPSPIFDSAGNVTGYSPGTTFRQSRGPGGTDVLAGLRIAARLFSGGVFVLKL